MTEERKRRGKIPFSEKLAAIDKRIAALQAKVKAVSEQRAEMIKVRRAEAEAVLKETA